uniref:Uncharacterized protein n=1 Tax=Molossus molossus TaxID=27622 RepID=A0A7J8K3D0_MOLMO|nr:hypothetical protein HJG59_017551 [Molossus molossus]
MDPSTDRRPFEDAPQTWPSCLCHGFIIFLGFLLLLITFPISGWFALKEG